MSTEKNEITKGKILFWIWLFFPYGIYLLIKKTKQPERSADLKERNDSTAVQKNPVAKTVHTNVADSKGLSSNQINYLNRLKKIHASNKSSGTGSHAKTTKQKQRPNENPKKTKVKKDPYKAWVNKKKNEERRKREKKRLMNVHGVSENIANQLFKRWKNLSSIKSAPVKTLTQFNGISEKIANDIKNL